MKTWLPVLLSAVGVCGCGRQDAQNSGEATLDDLNRVYSVMCIGTARRPATVNDLTNFPSLRGKTLPKPPPGKKLVIDPSQRKVVFVDD